MHWYQVSALLTFLRERKCARTEGKKKMEVMLVLTYLRIIEIVCAKCDITIRSTDMNGVEQQRRLRNTAGSRSKVLKAPRQGAFHRGMPSCQRKPFCKSCVGDNEKKKGKKIKLSMILPELLIFWAYFENRVENRLRGDSMFKRPL